MLLLPAEAQESELLLLNLQGQILLREVVPASQPLWEVDVAQLPPGYYQLQVQGKSTPVIGRFVKA